jgi:hypothetical protein
MASASIVQQALNQALASLLTHGAVHVRKSQHSALDRAHVWSITFPSQLAALEYLRADMLDEHSADISIARIAQGTQSQALKASL